MMNNQPPKFFLRFFRWFCHPRLQKPIEGDLMELYDERVKEGGKKKADREFRWDVIRLFRRDIIKPAGGTYKLNSYGMVKNYFKVTFRNLVRQKLYATLNIGGLSIGIASFLLIFIYIQHERSFDRFYSNADYIYNIYQQQPNNISMGTNFYAVTPGALAPVLMKDYPEVAAATTMDTYSTLISAKKGHYYEEVIVGDENFFEVFPHEFVRGDRGEALSGPEGVVLTESFAEKLFPGENPMGEEIEFWAGKAFVTGVIKDPPANSSFAFSCVLSMHASTYYRSERVKEAWDGNSYYTFLTFNESADVEAFEGKMKQLVKERWIHTGIPCTYFVQPFTDFHLRENINEEIGVKGNAQRLILFSVIAILILVLAGINYMNLAIARSVNRAKEVGLRKAIGARKAQLIFQFLIESTFLSFLALFAGLIIVQFALPVFGVIVERQLDINLINELNLLPVLIGTVLVLGLVSGSYPALFMSSLQPVLVLKGKTGQKSGGRLQKLLIIGQYSISIVMLICSLIAYRQMDFISKKELGFQKDQIVAVRVRGSDMRENMDVIKNRFQNFSNVKSVTLTSSLPTNVQSSTFLNMDRTGGNIYRLYTDDKFLDVYEVELLSGRFLSEGAPLEEESDYLLNETAARALGWTPESAVGKVYVNEGGHRKNIIGVVADFHMHSMHQPIGPLMISKRNQVGYISVKLSGGNIPETLLHLQETVEEYSNYPFDYTFIDDHFDRIYEEEKRQGALLGVFTLLAVIVAGLGLFGLASFEAVQNKKEMGIRKVLGASIQNIVWLFGKRFLLLVIISFFISIPISWYLASEWLEGFAYRITLSWWMFGLAGAFAIAIAFLTISSQSLKAALVNPVESLKDE